MFTFQGPSFFTIKNLSPPQFLLHPPPNLNNDRVFNDRVFHYDLAQDV